MSDSLSDLSSKSIQEISECSNLKELELLRVKYLGKKGAITKQLKALGKLTSSERPKAGKKINEIIIIPVKKKIENIKFLIIVIKSYIKSLCFCLFLITLIFDPFINSSVGLGLKL